ncbi:MAG: hypothetical protein B6D70_14120 [gamma proteobacterium symbiont of Stewartia floridana]|nr:hypothetical protein [Candidatus Thiodiazotropha taylori]RLW51935.1 MAG: hypothetical protein B6D76_17570 [gamma proteobacterium symbiont of Stewartia floridana]RLW54015.1 MAG: hypothetical protein B6D69_05480 [gamma proteobacterium symbiont of Stewartia floridana]RLW57811.1 MAG: hypothetical protein B6D75_16095 [gamma proteobacterium symbiont of Stewartia floridana]RLW58006.1 MAG: hypothetical protein B6D70_14120 [gamma proteobacterium symbiont of Stewartia floridana]
MSNQARLLTGISLCSVLFCSPLQAKEVTCHLHTPADYNKFSKQPLVIPAVGNPSECAQLNLRSFSNRGRCHCPQSGISFQENSSPTDFSSSRNRPELLP